MQTVDNSIQGRLRAAYTERRQYTDRLEAAGYTVTGAGMNLEELVWDVDVRSPSRGVRAHLVGPEAAEAFLASAEVLLRAEKEA